MASFGKDFGIVGNFLRTVKKSLWAPRSNCRVFSKENDKESLEVSICFLLKKGIEKVKEYNI